MIVKTPISSASSPVEKQNLPDSIFWSNYWEAFYQFLHFSTPYDKSSKKSTKILLKVILWDTFSLQFQADATLTFLSQNLALVWEWLFEKWWIKSREKLHGNVKNVLFFFFFFFFFWRMYGWKWVRRKKWFSNNHFQTRAYFSFASVSKLVGTKSTYSKRYQAEVNIESKTNTIRWLSILTN